jgi:hypothetical protein
MFYVSVNRWEDERCVNSTTILQKELTKVPEANGDLPGFDWASDLADMAWNVVIRERSAQNAAPVRGTNSSYRDTTEKPFLS